MKLQLLVTGMLNEDADEEAFEDNAEEYMRRDVEGSGTRVLFTLKMHICRK